MNKSRLLLLIGLCASTGVSAATAPGFAWVVAAGGTDGVKCETIGTAAAADRLGNIYVAGLLSGTSSFGTNVIDADGRVPAIFLAKYNSEGQVAWVRNVFPGKGLEANAVTLDGAGGIYVAGAGEPAAHGTTRSMVLFKYDQNGNALWTNTAGVSWTAAFNGPTGEATATAVSVAKSGDIYAAGSFTGQPAFGSTNNVFLGVFPHAAGGTFVTNSGGSDLFLAKYNSAGKFQWVTTAGGSLDDSAYGVSAAGDGSIWLAGSFQKQVLFGNVTLISTNEFTGDEAFFAKYDSSGLPLTASGSLGNPENKVGDAIAADSLNGACIAGRFSAGTMTLGPFALTNLLSSPGFSPYTDTFLARLAPDGKVSWLKFIDRQTAGFGRDKSAVGLALDSGDNAVLTGSYNDNPTFETFELSLSPPGLFVAKSNGAGAFQWAVPAGALRASGQEWTGGGAAFVGNNVAVDASANVYLTGLYRGPSVFGAYALTSHTDQFGVPDYSLFLAKLGVGGPQPSGPHFGSFSFFPGAAIQFSVDAPNTAVVVIQRATNLSNWQTIGTNTVVNGLVTLADPNVGLSPAQFYRVYLKP